MALDNSYASKKKIVELSGLAKKADKMTRICECFKCQI